MTPPTTPGQDLLRQALRRPTDSTSPAAIEASAAAISDEVMQDAIERRRRAALEHPANPPRTG